jgi:hypothetical protein
MKDKYRYMIYPDRTYVLTFEFGSIEVSGEDIHAMFRRGALLDTIFDELDASHNKLSTDNNHLDIGEL